MMKGLDRLEGIGTEETDEVEAVGREGVVEIEGYLLPREPTYYPAIYLEAPEHLTDFRKLTSVKVWEGVGRELAEAL